MNSTLLNVLWIKSHLILHVEKWLPCYRQRYLGGHHCISVNAKHAWRTICSSFEQDLSSVLQRGGALVLNVPLQTVVAGDADGVS